MAKNNNKYMNLFYGVKLPTMIDGQELTISVSENLESYFNSISQTGGTINVSKKAMKESGLLNVDELLTKVYWVSINLVQAGKPEKADLESAITEMSKLYKFVTGSHENELSGQQYSLVMNCVAVQAVGGKNAVIGNMKATSLATFKKSFLNALYNAYIQEKNFTLTDRQEKAKEKAFAPSPIRVKKEKTRKPQKGLQVEKTEKGLPNHA